jgi:hypothetical protein
MPRNLLAAATAILTSSCPPRRGFAMMTALLCACCFSENGEAVSSSDETSSSESTTSSSSEEDSGSSTGSSTTETSAAGSESGSDSQTEESGGTDIDYGLVFDGTSHGVAADFAALPEAYTIEFWVKTDGALHGTMLSAWGGTPRTGLFLYEENADWSAFDNCLVYIDYGAQPAWDYVVDPAFTINGEFGWRHVAATKDTSGVVRLFVDGALVVQHPFATPFAVSEHPLYLGMASDETTPLFGAIIDDLRISDVARYTVPFAPPADVVADDDTIHLWTFDEGTGNEAQDVVGGLSLALTDPSWAEAI